MSLCLTVLLIAAAHAQMTVNLKKPPRSMELSQIADLRVTFTAEVVSVASGVASYRNPLTGLVEGVRLRASTITRIGGFDTGAIYILVDFRSGSPRLRCYWEALPINTGRGLTTANYRFSGDLDPCEYGSFNKGAPCYIPIGGASIDSGVFVGGGDARAFLGLGGCEPPWPWPPEPQLDLDRK